MARAINKVKARPKGKKPSTVSRPRKAPPEAGPPADPRQVAERRRRIAATFDTAAFDASLPHSAAATAAEREKPY